MADTNGCSTTDSTNTTVNPSPTVQIAASQDTICEGESTALFAAGADSYAWNTGDITSTIIQNPAVGNTIYTVTGTDTNNCSANASYTILTNPSPNIQLTATDVACAGDSTGSIQVQAQNGTSFTYDWAGLNDTTATVNNITADNYAVTVTNDFGCATTDSTTVNETATIVPTVSTNNVSCFGANDGSITIDSVA